MKMGRKNFARNESGNVAMIAALTIIPIMAIAGFAIDFQMTTTQKARVQYAVDSAVLAATKSLESGKAEHLVFAETETYFRAVLSAHNTKYLTCQDLKFTFDDVMHEIGVTVRCANETTLSKIVGRNELEFDVNSSGVFGSGSLEVALILDTTGSMAGTRITALRQAAADFIDIVIKDDQEPFYSKASIIPYSVAINLGEYADAARGNITPGRTISNATWQVGAQKSISGITRANPAVVTSNNHGFSNGDRVWISNVGGMSQVNNKVFTVANSAANTFQLQSTNSGKYSKYSNGGVIRKCLNTNCEVTVTANNHQFGNNDYVVIRNVNGMTDINTGNNATWRISNVTQHNFVLQSSVGPNYDAYTYGGTAYCTTLGCEFYRFLNKASNAQRVHQISTCVTERTGAHALTDVAPSTAPIGYNYPSTSNPCSAVAEMMPLTSNKAALNARIQSLAAGGSTAGHLGAAWGWYSLSPNFGYMFPTQSRPGAYGKVSLFKIAVLMTDGEYNSAYCNGVIAGDSTSGSGSTNDQINCNAQNGHAFDQALRYCAAMKQQGITIYTIGFEVVNDVRATQLVNQCATNASHVYMATGSAQLRQVFQQIALAINEVRLTR